MKTKKLIFLVLAAALLAAALCSCATNSNAIKVKLTFKAGDEYIYSGDVTLNVAEPTVINAVNEAVAGAGLSITLDDSGASVEKVGDYYKTTIDGIEYYWEFTINGALPEAGRANTNPIKEGDVIVYTFSTYNPQTKLYEAYKSSANLFGSEAAQTTEAADSTAEGETTAA